MKNFSIRKAIAAVTVGAVLFSGFGTCAFADNGAAAETALLGLSSEASSRGASSARSATAAVPAFTVTLNGQVVDNSYRQYPLLVYKDITYFPMTYYDCRFLGLETSWKGSSEGLYITATGVSGAYDAYKGSAKKKAVTA